MRAKGRSQGRFVALSGLRKIAGLPGSQFPVMVVDRTGLPVFFLSEWYRRKKASDPGRTPDTYLDMLLPWAGYLVQQGLAWNDAPDRIRAYLVEFLRTDVGCQVSPGQEDGYLLETTGASPLSKSSLGVLLAALTSLYDMMIDGGYYAYTNPMRSERLTSLKREHLRQVKNAGTPDHAGIRGESRQATHQAYPTAFFRQKRGRLWEPSVVMEPDEVQERIRTALDFMIAHATFQRDRVILLLLRQTGARLSEIVEMTVGGYRKACHAGQALVKNKGSRGREEKTIYFTPIIERQLQKYIQVERAAHDPQGRKRLEELDDSDALFLTERGTPYDRSAFYYHWNRLFEPAQKQFKKQDRVQFTPHDIRHLHVTTNMAKIKRSAQGDQGLEAELKDGFRLLMGWRSQETMDIYTHVLNKRKALLDIVLNEQEHEAEQRTAQIAQAPPLPKEPHGTSFEPPEPTKISPTDDVSWYEEE